MGWFGKSIFVIGVILSILLFMFDFSNTLEAIFISVIAGIIIFVLFTLISAIGHLNIISREKEDKSLSEKIIRRRTRNKIIGIVILIISIIIFLNSYLYVKALLGNDILVSLKIDKENFVMKNGEEGQFNVKAKVLTNPFCQANCSISLKDMNKGIILSYEKANIQVSSPFSKDYVLYSDSEEFGQNLYKISLECTTIKNKFCYTAKKVSKSRTKIISVSHELSDVQRMKKEELKNETENLANTLYAIQYKLNNLNINYSSLDLSKFENESNELYNLSDFNLQDINNLSILYNSQKYYELGLSLPIFREKVENIESKFNSFNSSFMSDIDNYNLLVNNVDLMYSNISFIEDYKFSNYSLPYALSFINNFNLMILKLNEYNTIENKIVLFNKLELEKENLLFIIENESNSNIPMENSIDVSIYSVNLSKIIIKNETYNPTFILDEPSPICCFNGECYECIDDSSLNYPVILVHGHSFNERLSAELSMESFNEMARALEEDGYINAGYFYESQYSDISKGYLGGINNSVVVEATYYLDTLVTDEGSFILDSKWESIDIYASRLNDIVSNVKYITGKDKVIIVAHSMGCLVTRRYIQLYGEEDLHKIVLVGGPNKGIDGFILNSCPVFGANLECSEMDKGSLFITELNNASLPNIPIYDIIGTGCPIEGSEGDGIVKVQSAYMEGAENIYVNGTCKGVDFFHVNMIKPSKYPEIYSLIKDLIKE